MRKALSVVLALAFVITLIPGCAKKEQSVITPEEGETVLYVSPTGDDEADGSFNAPLATFAGAKEKVRSILESSDVRVSVYFRGGDYSITEGLVFDESDSGTADSPVTYAAYPGETVRMLGGIKVDPSLITPSDLAQPIPSKVTDEAAKAALMTADLSSLIEEYPDPYCVRDTNSPSFKQVELYLGENAIEPSRWPNFAGTYEYNYTVLAEGDTIVGENNERTVFFGDDVAERSQNWTDDSLTHMYMSGYPQYDWIADNLNVTAFDRDACTVTYNSGTNRFSTATGKGGRVLYRNLPEEIDVPGESYIDREARIAYFYPTEDFDADNVWLSTLNDDMLTFEGASHFVFSGIEFLYMRGNAITVRDGDDFTLKNCKIAHTSAKAANFIHANRIHLDGCEIYDTANGAILMIGGDRTNLISSENIIENCDIHDYNRSGLTYSPEVDELITLYSATAYTPAIYDAAVGSVIRHNKIHGAVHQAISVESNDIVIEYNEIYDCMREAGDMGTIYYGRNPSLLGIVIHYNYFHDNGNVYPGSGQFDVYIDDGSMGAEIVGNLFTTTTSACVMMHGAQFAKITGNVFASTENAVRFTAWSSNGKMQGDWVMFLYDRGRHGCDAKPKMLAVNFDSDIWREHYAGTVWENLYNYVTTEKLTEYESLTNQELERKCKASCPYLTNECNSNVMVEVNEPFHADPVNEHDNIIDGDITLFTDAENGDYSFTEKALSDIQTVCPDFVPLPLDQIGPVKD